MFRVLSTKRCCLQSSQFQFSDLSHVFSGRQESYSTNFLCRRSRALFFSKSSSCRRSVYTYSPKRFPQIVAVPLMDRPLFPGFLTYANRVIEPEDMMDYRIGEGYFVGAFSLKDDEGTIPTVASTIETESSYDIKGKTLYDRLHKIGTIAKVRAWTIDEAKRAKMMLMGVGRIQITEMVNEDPLVVGVEHLKNKQYNKKGDDIKTTACELITTMKDVLKLKCEMAEQGQTFIEEVLKGNNLVFDDKNIYAEIGVESFYKKIDEPKQVQFIGDNFDYPLLADSVATMLGAPSQCLQVLAELNVETRLKLSLDLAKNELDLIRGRKKSISRAQTLVDEHILKFKAETRQQNRDRAVQGNSQLKAVAETGYLGKSWTKCYLTGG